MLVIYIYFLNILCYIRIYLIEWRNLRCIYTRAKYYLSVLWASKVFWRAVTRKCMSLPVVCVTVIHLILYFLFSLTCAVQIKFNCGKIVPCSWPWTLLVCFFIQFYYMHGLYVACPQLNWYPVKIFVRVSKKLFLIFKS